MQDHQKFLNLSRKVLTSKVTAWILGLNNILFDKLQDMLWKYMVEVGSDIKLLRLLWSIPNTCGSCNIHEHLDR